MCSPILEAMRGTAGAREKPLRVRGGIGAVLAAAGLAVVIAAWVDEDLSRQILIIGSENMAKLSDFSLAKLLGEISPKINTIIVITTVETVAPYLPYKSINNTVEIAVIAMFTILLPISMVVRSLS